MIQIVIRYCVFGFRTVPVALVKRWLALLGTERALGRCGEPRSVGLVSWGKRILPSCRLKCSLFPTVGESEFGIRSAVAQRKEDENDETRVCVCVKYQTSVDPPRVCGHPGIGQLLPHEFSHILCRIWFQHLAKLRK